MTTMCVEELVQAGELDQALSAIKDEVRAHPDRVEPRTKLFHLLCVMGDWERALTQLNIAVELDASLLLMAQIYRPALAIEAMRTEVFAGRRAPLVFGEPLEWVAWLIQALALIESGQTDAATELRERAFEAADATTGTIDGEPFEWLADADARLGPTLEAIIDGKYYWVPMMRIQQLRIEPPAALRDLLWASAQFTWTNGGTAVGLIPVRYPLSELETDSAFRLSRKTEWRDVGGGCFGGIGQRMLATDQNEYPLLEVREVVCHG